MSEQTVKALFERLKDDDAFRRRLRVASGPDERLALVQAEGFDCTGAEIEAAAHRLADDGLRGVVGGLGGAGPLMEQTPGGEPPSMWQGGCQ